MPTLQVLLLLHRKNLETGGDRIAELHQKSQLKEGTHEGRRASATVQLFLLLHLKIYCIIEDALHWFLHEKYCQVLSNSPNAAWQKNKGTMSQTVNCDIVGRDIERKGKEGKRKPEYLLR
ncbi:Hypothetical predicted protein [Olea europaea subsp. europaea]|uniref:Uncharacterized protein n=1 Tax=Olea europaea subsp. europaea TaxID=158383 RepID=A0A8S0SCT8_OLEEU|nr:Hypothetical predicted protein [Olea europaea subsp. europaea]